MRLMTPREKAEALNPDFGANYLSNIIMGYSRDKFIEHISPLEALIPDLDKDLTANASLIFNRLTPAKNKQGFLFHDFKNGDSLAVRPNRDIVFIKQGEHDLDIEREVVTNFAHKHIDGVSQRVFVHCGEEVVIGHPEVIVDHMNKNSSYRPSFVELALDEFGKRDIYIDGNSIYVPTELEHSAAIVILLSVNNPSSIKQKLENCIIYKDTGITLEDLKSHSEEITSMSFRYGTKIKGTRLNIVETDELFNIYFTKRKSSTKKLGKFSIYSV